MLAGLVPDNADVPQSMNWRFHSLHRREKIKHKDNDFFKATLKFLKVAAGNKPIYEQVLTAVEYTGELLGFLEFLDAAEEVWNFAGAIKSLKAIRVKRQAEVISAAEQHEYVKAVHSRLLWKGLTREISKFNERLMAGEFGGSGRPVNLTEAEYVGEVPLEQWMEEMARKAAEEGAENKPGPEVATPTTVA